MAETQQLKQPVVRVTRYDLVSSFLIAIVLTLVCAVFVLTMLWATIRVTPPKKPVTVEIVELPGGVEDGSLTETLRLDSPEAINEEATIAEAAPDDAVSEETLDNITEVAAEATGFTDKQFRLDNRSAGIVGSAVGTGRRGRGKGPGKAGMPREQRWFVSFADRQTIEEYARQLEYFGVELGALSDSGELVYLSNLTAPTPQTRRSTSGKDEKRLYMIWQGGNRRQADIELFKRAGVDVARSQIFQFYSPETEQKLATLELEFRNRPVTQIRRTYFTVIQTGRDYRFEVTQQAYFN